MAWCILEVRDPKRTWAFVVTGLLCNPGYDLDFQKVWRGLSSRYWALYWFSCDILCLLSAVKLSFLSWSTHSSRRRALDFRCSPDRLASTLVEFWDLVGLRAPVFSPCTSRMSYIVICTRIWSVTITPFHRGLIFSYNLLRLKSRSRRLSLDACSPHTIYCIYHNIFG